MRRRRIGRLLLFGLCFGVLTLGMARGAHAQSITVTNTNDSGPGSLREAIANAAPGDTIDFAGLTGCPCTIALTFGELVIDKNLTIRGPGPGFLTVSGDQRSRVFRIAAGVVARLQGLQIREGGGVGGGDLTEEGGGILNEGELTVVDTLITQNTSLGIGGGIFSQGPLTLRSSHVVQNVGAQAGGLHAAGSLLVIGSTITSNSSTGSGGGLRTQRDVLVISSTIANNSARVEGGGLRADGGSATFVNTTVSNNDAAFGGGISLNNDVRITLVNATVTGNEASDGAGGIEADEDAFVVLNNTILSGNFPRDIAFSGVPELEENHSLVSEDVAPILVQELTDNGGVTQTHALVPNSPAINAGDAALLPADTVDLDGDGDITEALPFDQRGVGFPRIAGTTVDIGAVEAVCSAIAVTRTPTPAPSVGVAYSETIVANGGTGPYNFAATGLPGGLALSPTTGVVSGTPTTSGTFTVTVTATDTSGCAGTLTFTLTIADPSCGIVIGPAALETPYLATLYYQPVSVTPSGKYTVTVAAGALPQGVYLFAIGHNWFLGGIPTKPGEYTFTLAATKKNSPCAPTRTYTVIVPATVLPQLTCVAKTGGKQYTARFGYDNSTDAAVTIPVGADNYFTPGAQDRGQVTTFQKGRVTNAFSVVFTVKNNHTDLALWYLRGPDNVRRPVNITTATSRCP